jgi:hypothetical protein
MHKRAEKDHSAEQENTSPQKPPSTRDRELNEAAERVYRQYGNDLSAFYRNAQREKALEKRG